MVEGLGLQPRWVQDLAVWGVGTDVALSILAFKISRLVDSKARCQGVVQG